jgi:hypothetical protein
MKIISKITQKSQLNENYIQDYSKKSTQEEKPPDNLTSTTHESNKDKSKHDDDNIIDKKIDVHEYEQKCWKILEDDEIRFAGLLDESGTILAGGYRQGINSRLTEEQHQSVCKELASRVTKRKKFDNQLGLVRYSASRREHVVIMSFPIYEKVIMVVAEPNINIDRFSFRILNKLGKQWSDVT